MKNHTHDIDLHDLATNLCRLKPEAMSDLEMDQVMAVLLKKNILTIQNEVSIKTAEGNYRVFSPMNKSEDFLEVLSNLGLVTGSHEEYEDKEDHERVTGYYFTCHAYESGTQCDYADTLQGAVGIACARLLDAHMSYESSWKKGLGTSEKPSLGGLK